MTKPDAEHYNDVNRRTHWHISKEVTWGHILTTVTLLLTVAALWGDLDDRVDENTMERKHNRELINEVKESAMTARVEMRQEFRNVNDKLDRLIERILVRHERQHLGGGQNGQGE
ncbi:MAG: hypothetical protein U9Q19_02640 [Pseudomonadota bacterium]|nr:hypothetical protein [Pseudomonadota bacterium]